MATFKILPGDDGAYMCQFAGVTQLDDKVLNIIPIDVDQGTPALATASIVAGLRTGAKVNGVVIAVTVSGCRIFKPATSKGAHKSWDDYLCDAAAVVKTEGRGYSLVGLFGDGNARAFSIPGLKEIGCTSIHQIADMRRLSDSTVCPDGSVLTWTGPSEVAVFSVWGSGTGLYGPLSLDPVFVQRKKRPANKHDRRSSDCRLFNPQAAIPARPTITNLQWISGTQYVSPADMDLLSMCIRCSCDNKFR